MSTDDDSDSSAYEICRSAKRSNASRGRRKTRKNSGGEEERSRRNNNAGRINYRDPSSGEEINSDDVLEWEEEDASNAAVSDQIASSAETIEKVIRHRAGYPGATGSITTCYNVEDKGDPNDKAPSENLERQFLIKWAGWSHLHNTWESEASLKTVNAKGMKKIDNYLKRLREIEEWKRTADKEYIEFLDCEQEMNEELFEQYKIVERVIAHQVSRDKGDEDGVEYYIKWSGLPYSECTWEDSHLIARRYQDKIDDYYARYKNPKIPNKTCPALKKRPKFKKLEDVSFLLKLGDTDHELRDYQLEGVNWMLHAWTKENSVILADEMGLGKTIQGIAFLSALFHIHEVYGPFLVVVPLSTMAAWQREFENWAHDLNVVTYMGDATSRDYIRQYEMFVAGSKRIKVNVVLTTYEILLKDKTFLGAYDWAVLAVDEAHRLKNDESLLYRCLFDFSTNFRLLITGTPLQNSLKELWALLHFIMPLRFESWSDFEREHHDSDHKAIASLHRKLEPFLLRRVKKDVEKSLPFMKLKRLLKVEQILRVDMTAQQKQYYKWILTKNYKELSKGVKGSINGFVNLIMELKKCCNHASLVRPYDNFEQGASARLQQLLKSSGKLILLDKLLCRLHETGHRVLIFSQMVMMLDIVQEYLQLRRFPSQRLDGSMRADLRKAALDHFNAEGSSDFCFLLSTRAGGLGINLATADTVIIFDSDWNPQNDLQAMSRAHRIGQKKQVNIYRLVTKGSVEEEIVERAKRKLVLDHLVIQRMDTTGRTVLSKSNSANGTVPFEKHELAAILKFGAEELFKEKEGEEQEPEVDIDNILQGAETRECDQLDTGSELLNAFKYANFAIDEEKDNWEDIIPEEDRKKVEEEEREKAEKDLFLGPRNRTKVFYSDDEGSDEERRRRNKKKGIFGFTDTEIRRFVKSFRKFATPLTRLEAIAQDAELEEHSKNELEQLANELLQGCQKAQEEYEKITKESEKKIDRGPVYKLGGIDVYVRPLLKMHADLKPLYDMVEKYSERGLIIPGHPKQQRGWDISWKMEDDLALLRGVYRYGLGSWEAIKMDPDYGLVDKIWLKDKNKKPQGKHLQTRVDALLKHIARYVNNYEDTTKRKGHSLKIAGQGVSTPVYFFLI
uniref:Chromodomain-helicase-DNA-binding protein 1 n=1 Tax=Syphacia muris TaxID=451379 RepID=A0A0N5APN4_9BILA